ncbi:hypothetical protein K2173_020492 [Erythroxylum novogranatense]|uniref:Uncharacterized protein n=1 Tax=Erythroxylum novogranatense TaxID=1862640 RepID=A0AAV8THW8_9ROSI|nr:hypothetical protein K2173_020492 [Erythroxylum novogranatense]
MAVARKIYPEGLGNTEASSPREKSNSMEFDSGQSHVVSAILAPAFASEFPIKDSSPLLRPAQHSSSIHVTAGMIRIENMTLDGNGMDLSLGKNWNVSVALSFGLSRGDVSPTSSVPTSTLPPQKTGSVVWQFTELACTK